MKLVDSKRRLSPLRRSPMAKKDPPATPVMPDGSIAWTESSEPRPGGEQPPEHYTGDNWSLVSGGQHSSYYDYYTSDEIDPVWGRDSLRGTALERAESAQSAPRNESHCQTRKRGYIEGLFRGVLIRLRLEAAVGLAGTYRHGLDLLHGLTSEWTTSPGAASVERQAPAPAADLAHVLELSQTLESRRSQVRALLARYAGLHQDMRTALNAMLLAQNLARMQAERNEVVKELDGELHYSLRTLRSEREILSAPESGTQSPQRWKLFPKASLAEAAPSAGKQDERLRTVEARLAALDERQHRLLERRDSLNQDLSRVRKTLEDLGIDPDDAGTQAKARQSAVEAREAEVRGTLSAAFAAEREVESQLRDFSTPLAEYVSTFASGREQPPLEDLIDGLSCFVTLPEPAPSFQDLVGLAQRIASTLARASTLVGETHPPPATAAPPTTALDTDLSLNPEALLRAHAARQAPTEVPDGAAVHQAIKDWFITVKERVQELSEEPMVAFEDLLLAAAPPFLRPVVGDESREFHEVHGSFERGC
jgi:hypothetical protein